MAAFETKTRILEGTDSGAILEVVLAGKHSSGSGHEIVRCVKEAVATSAPAAVVLNMLDFKYRFGDDIGGIVQVFYDSEGRHLRPGPQYLPGLRREAGTSPA